ncbi:hypothetical protein NQZ79_g591 [Umbelopsis isabellina]|nr:hypothetical protein NQZ79_g591 [Umbelopsis isabellina]
MKVVAKRNAPYERDEMSCQLLFINDILRAVPQDVHRESGQTYTGNFRLNISNTSTIEFQNVRVCGTIVKTNFISQSEDFVFDKELEALKAPDKITLDDGTATIVVTCSARVRNRADADLLRVGTTATVIGQVQIRQDSRLVECKGFDIHLDPTYEIVHGLRVIQMRNLHVNLSSNPSIIATQLSILSQDTPRLRRALQSQSMPVPSPSKPESSDFRISEIEVREKRPNPLTDDNFDDSLSAEDLDSLMNAADKRQKVEHYCLPSSQENFGDSLPLASQPDNETTQRVLGLLNHNGMTLKDFILAGLDFLAVEDSLSYLLGTGQVYEREERYYIL